jgi:hypothetical protein
MTAEATPWVLPLLCSLVLASAASCYELPEEAGAKDPATQPSAQPAAREPTFADRSKRDDFDRARASLAELQRVLATGLDSRQTSALGFQCASLRSLQKSLLSESDPLVGRVVADIEKACGFDVPLASAQVEIAQIEAKRKADGPSANVKGECLGLKLAIGDIGSAYSSNPEVADIGGKFAAYCSSGL